MKGLPKKKASPMPNSIMAMPMAMSLTLRELADPAVEQRRSTAPASPAASTPSQGEPVMYGDGVADHRAEDERAFEAEIDAAGLLGDGLAEADEDERRRDADGAAEHGERHAPQAEVGLVHQALLFHGRA